MLVSVSCGRGPGEKRAGCDSRRPHQRLRRNGQSPTVRRQRPIGCRGSCSASRLLAIESWLCAQRQAARQLAQPGIQYPARSGQHRGGLPTQNPKPEIRSSKEYRNPKCETRSGRRARPLVAVPDPRAPVIRTSSFELVADFGFRTSDFTWGRGRQAMHLACKSRGRGTAALPADSTNFEGRRMNEECRMCLCALAAVSTFFILPSPFLSQGSVPAARP